LEYSDQTLQADRYYGVATGKCW